LGRGDSQPEEDYGYGVGKGAKKKGIKKNAGGTSFVKGTKVSFRARTASAILSMGEFEKGGERPKRLGKRGVIIGDEMAVGIMQVPLRFGKGFNASLASCKSGEDLDGGGRQQDRIASSNGVFQIDLGAERRDRGSKRGKQNKLISFIRPQRNFLSHESQALMGPIPLLVKAELTRCAKRETIRDQQKRIQKIYILRSDCAELHVLLLKPEEGGTPHSSAKGEKFSLTELPEQSLGR